MKHPMPSTPHFEALELEREQLDRCPTPKIPDGPKHFADTLTPYEDIHVAIESHNVHYQSSSAATTTTTGEYHCGKTTLAMKFRSIWNQSLWRECVCECLATYVLLCYGLSVNLSVLLSTDLKDPHGTFISINISWGIAIMLILYIGGGITGGHINPAVSIAFATIGKLNPLKIPFYVASQCIGAFLGAATAYSLYYSSLHKLNDYGIHTAAMFAPVPKEHVTNVNAFWTECFATFIMMVCLGAIEDERNCAATKATKPIIVGLMIMAIGMSFGYNTGYAINPARDFGPRLFTALAGWGMDVFKYHQSWFWIPIVAPTIGATGGIWTYRFTIEALHPVAISEPAQMAACTMLPRYCNDRASSLASTCTNSSQHVCAV